MDPADSEKPAAPQQHEHNAKRVGDANDLPQPTNDTIHNTGTGSPLVYPTHNDQIDSNHLQAWQGAQIQPIGGGSDPDIKSEFSPTFQGLGSGVDGSITPSRGSPTRGGLEISLYSLMDPMEPSLENSDPFFAWYGTENQDHVYGGKIPAMRPLSAEFAGSPSRLPGIHTLLNSAYKQDEAPHERSTLSRKRVHRAAFASAYPSATMTVEPISSLVLSPPSGVLRREDNPSHSSAQETRAVSESFDAVNQHMLPTLESDSKLSTEGYMPTLLSTTGVEHSAVNPSITTHMGIGGYKCDFPGCTEPPFQTSYLFHSHKQAHFTNYSHYCAFSGCTRGEGGKGFMRIAHVIRHVRSRHSPRYVCPFCPDGEHMCSWLRDLKRHVRVHHVDQDPDDPLLNVALMTPAEREAGKTGKIVYVFCPHCKIRFFGQWGLQMHISTSHPEKRENKHPQSDSHQDIRTHIQRSPTMSSTGEPLIGHISDSLDIYPSHAATKYETKAEIFHMTNPVPSDSGYHSGIGTDTESVCSIDSSGSSLGLPTDFLQEFISLFVELLIEKAGARIWAPYALVKHQPAFVEQCLTMLLKIYTVDLSSEVEVSQTADKNSKVALDAIRLIRRYRPKIARYFCTEAVAASSRVESMEARLQDPGKTLSLAERVDLLHKDSLDREQHEPDDEVNDEDDFDEVPIDLNPIRQFLLAGGPFKRLVIAMRQTLYYNDESPLDSIDYTIRQGVPSSPAGSIPESNHCSTFSVDWNLLRFLQEQYQGHAPPLAKVVSISGFALYAQATTCYEYLQANWPRTGLFFLDVLERAVNDIDIRIPAHKRHSVAAKHPNEHLQLNIRLIGYEKDAPTLGSISVQASGTIDMLVEVAQQLCWIGSALRSSTLEDRISYANAQIHADNTTEDMRFEIKFHVEPLHETEKPCWLPLFSNAVIARAFPFPDRHDEMGLEIPIHLMAGLAGVRHAVEYEGGVVLKGMSTMLAPMKRAEDRVQWHLISTSDEEKRLTYRDGVDRLPNRAKCDQFRLNHIQTTRAFIGWCSATNSALGHDSANYENIDYSGAIDSASDFKISGGTFGFQQFGVAQLNYALGAKDGKCHFHRKGPYRNIVAVAEKTPIVLYDISEKRAWLVPASGVILHIAQNRHGLTPFEVDGRPVDSFLSSHSGQSARDVLVQHALTILSDDADDTLQDMTTNIWSILEFLLDQNVRWDTAAGMPIKGTVRDTLRGFEFKAVVEEISPYRRKQCYVEKTSGGWTSLVKDIDALVLFASGFEDLIYPTDSSRDLCHRWRRVPKRKDYLATTVRMLKGLYNTAGCRLDRQYLTSTRLQWHRGKSMLFEPCPYLGAFRCQCNRLQQIIPKSALGCVDAPGPLENDHGGVIFGQSTSAILQPDFTKQPQKTQIYSQPNISLSMTKPEHYEQNIPILTVSESESSYHDSDLSEVNQASSATSYTSQAQLDAQMQDLLSPSPGCSTPQKRYWTQDSEPDDDTDTQSATFLRAYKRPKFGAASLRQLEDDE